jgi:murein DD-endopeptidase MepM/ murein hydrolase activator NlpD
LIESGVQSETSGGHRRVQTSAAMLGLALSFGASAPLLTEPELALAADGATLTVLPVAHRSGADTGLSLKSAGPSSGYHTVEPGESLWQIAAQHDADVQLLKSVNGINSDEVIRAGQVLRVPAVGLSGLVATTNSDRLAAKHGFLGGVGGDMVAAASLPPGSLPLVRDLEDIAELDAQADQLTVDFDGADEQIIAKELEKAEVSHPDLLVALLPQVDPAVVPASVGVNSAWSVSESEAIDQAFEVSPASVQVASAPGGLVASAPEAVVATLPLHTEEELASVRGQARPQTNANADFTPAKKDLVAVALPMLPATQPAVAEVTSLGSYQVKPGDTLWSIASRHGITLDELLSHNTVSNAESLSVGEQLSVPVSTAAVVTEVPELEVLAPATLSSLPSLSTSSRNREQVIRDHLARIREANNALVDRDQLNALIREARQELDRVRTGGSNAEVVALEYYSSDAVDEPMAVSAIGEQAAQATLARAPRASAQSVAAQWTVTDVAQTAAPVESEQIAAVLTELEPAASQPANLERAVSSPQLLAAAPLSAEAYRMAPSLPIGQTVSPSMPMMPGANEFLPEAPALANGFIWPSRGTLTSGYGWRWGRMHQGIDIAGPVGTPIVAAASGVVVRSGWNSGGYGNLVDIRHPDGSLTRYAHNSRLLVRQGEQVRQGQQIAEMGSTGFSTGPHLHFEIHMPNSGTVNPMALLPGR